MDKNETEWMKLVLESKHEQLSGSCRNLGDITAENVPDPLDHVQLMGERELAIRNLDRDSATLRQIRHALERVAAGTFGVCARCEDDIAVKRLAAVPWSAFCIKCQEYLDSQKAEGGGDSAEQYEKAA